MIAPSSTNTAPVAIFNANGTPAPLAPPTYLTPDALLAYCSTRLNNLDSQMQAQFTQQQSNIADAQTLQGIEQQLKDLFTSEPKDSSGNLSSDIASDKYVAQIVGYLAGSSTASSATDARLQAIEQEIDKIQDPSAKSTAQAALSAYANMKAGTGEDGFKSSVLDGLDSGQQSLSQGQELGMISLQSIMSERQTAVQMTTNLMESLGDQIKGIADNVGK